jgi:hypothetical protein
MSGAYVALADQPPVPFNRVKRVTIKFNESADRTQYSLEIPSILQEQALLKREARVARAIDFSHAARAQRRLDFVRSKFRARCEPHALRVIIVPWQDDTHLEPRKQYSALDSRHHAITPVGRLNWPIVMPARV